VSSTVLLSATTFKFDKIVVDGLVNSLAKMGVMLSLIADWFDVYIVDGLVNAFASLAKTIGNFARHFQTGRLQHYLLTMVVVVLAFFVIKLVLQGI
jgi:NADH-quinone oxidoreductase subunit L